MTADAPITRALTILDPLAYLIVSGFKSVENRTWAPRNRDGSPFRGRVAIHTSKSTKLFRDADLLDEIIDTDPLGRIADAMDDDRVREDGRHLFHLGHIIGSVEIVEAISLPSGGIELDALREILRALPTPTGFAADIPEENWVQGGTMLILRNAKRYRRAIPAAGKLNMWYLTESHRRMVAAAETDTIPQDDPGCPAERMAR